MAPEQYIKQDIALAEIFMLREKLFDQLRTYQDGFNPLATASIHHLAHGRLDEAANLYIRLRAMTYIFAITTQEILSIMIGRIEVDEEAMVKVREVMRPKGGEAAE